MEEDSLDRYAVPFFAFLHVCVLVYLSGMWGSEDALVRVSIAVMQHHNQKASWGGKGLFILIFHINVHHQRKSGQGLKYSRNLEAGANEEAWSGAASWLVLHALLSRFLIETKVTSSGMAPPTMGQTLLHHSLIKKMPYKPALSYGVIFLTEIPFSLMTLACLKFT